MSQSNHPNQSNHSNHSYEIVKKDGYIFNILSLPNTNYFKLEMINKIGSNVEKLYKIKTGKNIYGMSHLIEHLSFKSPKDFTSTELNELIISEGECNATTDKNRINYWFETTMSKVDLGIKVITNITFNDLKAISLKEFELERNIVINEVKRYNDDEQNMFWFNTGRELCEEEEGDNIIGEVDNIVNFSLEDCIKVKELMLSREEHIFNVTYDPKMITQAELLNKIINEIKRFKINKSPKSSENSQKNEILNLEDYNSHIKLPKMKSFISDNKSNQVMTYICIDCIENIITTNLANSYLVSYSKTSLNELIREQNGLTYGVYFSTDNINGKEFTYFGCDVSKGTEEKMLNLFKESINKSVNEFDFEKYKKFMEIKSLKKVMSSMDRKNYNSWHEMNTWHPYIVKSLEKELKQNIDLAHIKSNELYGSYDNILDYMKIVQEKINNEDYGIVQNKS